VRSSAQISPQVGKELAQNGLYALLFVLFGFGVYISAASNGSSRPRRS
jgi:preprotein translocase subunit SecF